MKEKIVVLKGDLNVINPHDLFVAGESASTKPRRVSLLCTRLLMLVLLCLVFQSLDAATELSNVSVRQRYPWNGLVDVWFNLSSTRSSSRVSLEVLDMKNGKNLPAYTFYADNGQPLVLPNKFVPGNHHVVWDAAADIRGEYKTDSLSVSVTAGPYYEGAPFMVYDLSGGVTAARWPSTYLSEVPEEGWTDEYRTTKLVFRLVQAGTYLEGPDATIMTAKGLSRKVTLTKPFYVCLFRVTEKQWELVTGIRKNADRLDTDPVEVDYIHIRGNNKGYQWPSSREVDEGSFLYYWRSKFGGDTRFELPTDAQWEYFARAGTTSNSLISDPNAWGIYDLGISRTVEGEWCADWSSVFSDESPKVDPLGPSKDASLYNAHAIRCPARGQRWNPNGDAINYRFYQQDLSEIDKPSSSELGFRFVIQLD